MSTPDTPCEGCASDLEIPLRCTVCGVFQTPDPARDHFATFGLERRFDITEDFLEQRLVRWSLLLHPDQAGAEQDVRTRAILHSAQFNEAFEILRDPFLRADYLLELERGPSAREQRGVPDGFLERMLELRDELEEILTSGDRRRAVGFRRMVKDELEKLEARLGDAFARLSDGPRREILEQIREILNVASYYRGLQRDLKEAR